MDNDVLNALKSRACYLPGGRDFDRRIILIVNILNDLEQGNQKLLETCINYIKRSLSHNVLTAHGIAIIIDAQKCSPRTIRIQLNEINNLLSDIDNKKILLVKSECFWEKHVDHCAKHNNKDELIVVSKLRLQKFIDTNELPEEFGGSLYYNHDLWLQNRVQFDEFKMKYEKIIRDLDNLHKELLNNKLIIPSGFDLVFKSCSKLYKNVQIELEKTIDDGNQLVMHISCTYFSNDIDISYNNKTATMVTTPSSSSSIKIPQDLSNAIENIQEMLNDIEKHQTNVRLAWLQFLKLLHDSRELSALEEGVTYVTNWILGTGEQILNRHYRIGCDVSSCEELRLEHEKFEYDCSEIYGFYAELLYRIKSYSSDKETLAYKDLMLQKDFMDFVCRSFATRIERRRTLLIISSKFYRLVSEYFDKTSDVFESLVMGNKVEDFELAANNLEKLKESQQILEIVEKELIKDGEKLSDILAMPVKDSLGRDLAVDYSDDIVNIRDILDATIARRNIFIDSVELQKLTLEQVTHIQKYENDLKMTIKWMNALYNVMIKCHSHVGCSMHEIQVQKDELQTFQETGKNIFNYGCQLVEASLSLRQSCKFNIDVTHSMSYKLKQTWFYLQTISQEHMVRLRVSAVFHRSVEEYSQKLLDLKSAVHQLNVMIDEPERRCIRLRKYLSLREQLLVEVGRMVRLGKLLKTRLKEPFILDDTNIENMTHTISNSSYCSEQSTPTEINGRTSVENPPPLPLTLPPLLTPTTLSPSTSTSSTSLASTQTVISPIGNNAIACDAITNKLTDIAEIAELLDTTLRNSQNGLDLMETNSSSSEKKFDPNANCSFDDYSLRSIEDDSFATASECTYVPQSRSSSYQTASEARTLSPYWSSFEKADENATDDNEEISEIDLDSNLLQLRLNNGQTSSPNASGGGGSATGTLSSANVSFDSSDYLSAQSNHSPLSSGGVTDSSAGEARILDDSGIASVELRTDKSRSQTPTPIKNGYASNNHHNHVNDNTTQEKTEADKVSCVEVQPIEWDERKLYKSSVAKQAIKRFL